MFFALSKILWALFMPSTLLVLATWVVLVLVLLGKSMRRTVKAMIVLYALIAILPLGDWALGVFERQVPSPPLPQQVDGIIVLGGAIDTDITFDHQMVALNGAAERLTALPDLMRRYKRAQVVFTGGSGHLRGSDHREADDARELFKHWDVPADSVLFERDSRNTYENALNSQKLISPKPGEKWLLLTSAAHMPRASAVFAKAGWPVIPYNVDYRARLHPPVFCLCALDSLQKLDQAAYELTGMLFYRLTGKI